MKPRPLVCDSKWKAGSIHIGASYLIIDTVYSHSVSWDIHRAVSPPSSGDNHVDHQERTIRALPATHNQLPLSFSEGSSIDEA